ncbi:MAG: thioredoxin domain-containing protein [Candidatus Absconditabacteria bacterium]
MHKEGKYDIEKIALIGIVGINLLLSLYLAFFKADAVWLETLKSGGSENFNLVRQLYNSDAYKAQQKQTLEQVLSSFGSKGTTGGTAQEAAPTTAETPSEASTLSQDTIKSILAGAHFQGKEDAKIVLVEYSDLLCPFCKRHYNDQTMEKVVQKYPNDVALVFKNMPLPQLHPTAPKGAQGLYCAGKLGGSDKYYAYMAEAFKAEEFTDTSVVDIAKGLGLNTTQFTACYNDQATKDAVDASVKEGNSLFGINGTPGNVVINRETGKYVVVNGAYPFEKFDTEVSALLK